MSYLEELFPEFRKGAKIRQTTWNNGEYIYLGENGIIYDERNKPFDFTNEELFANWEFYQEPIDWEYIIKNKCPCWFWDNDEDKFLQISVLKKIINNPCYPYLSASSMQYKYCRPVRRDEITFYEDTRCCKE